MNTSIAWENHVEPEVTLGHLLTHEAETPFKGLVLSCEGVAFYLADIDYEPGDFFLEGTHDTFSCRSIYLEVWIGGEMVWAPLSKNGKELFLAKKRKDILEASNVARSAQKRII